MRSQAATYDGEAPVGTPLPRFPVPRVPKNPVLGWSSFARETARRDPVDSGVAPPSVLSLPHKRFVTSARVAIALALRRLGVGPGDRVLVPAYHCLSMVEPIVFCGARPVFFPLTPRLEIPLAGVAALDLTGVRAILVTHYFGFPQAMSAIAVFAAARGIAIIEDCAHAVFGSVDGRPIGAWGDYAAVSLMKFFPVYDGGCIVSATHSLDALELHRPSGRFEAKALFNSVERGLSYQRFPGVQTAARLAFGAKDMVWRGIKRVRSARATQPFAYQDPAASEGVNGLDPAWLDCGISYASRRLVEHLPVARIVERRRRHFRRLLDAFRDLPGARPLFDALPDDVVPYVFPLWVDRPGRVFVRLKNEGVPLFRWERLWNDDAAHVDPLSARYATEIFQLPCHQELTDDDLDWIIRRVRAAFGAARSGQAS